MAKAVLRKEVVCSAKKGLLVTHVELRRTKESKPAYYDTLTITEAIDVSFPLVL